MGHMVHHQTRRHAITHKPCIRLRSSQLARWHERGNGPPSLLTVACMQNASKANGSRHWGKPSPQLLIFTVASPAATPPLACFGALVDLVVAQGGTHSRARALVDSLRGMIGGISYSTQMRSLLYAALRR